MKKKCLAMLLSIVMVVSLLSGTAWAADTDFVIKDGFLVEYQGPGGTVTIPNNVTNIDVGAFSGCGDLINVTIPNSVISIGQGAFDSCSGLTSVTIPDSVVSIDYCAFGNCSNLASVTIPSSVTYLDIMAFAGSSNLANVYYGGSEEQWKQIFVDAYYDDNPLINATIHYNSVGPGTTSTQPSTPITPAFTDIAAGAFYVAAVNWAVSGGITNGTSDTTFSPGQDCTQAQILTFLYRAAQGEGHTAADTDMDAAVEWAKDKGMIDDAFERTKPCTRATAVSYIWQALGRAPAKASGFTDVPAGSDYAAAVDWALANGVTNGTTDTTFGPGEVCSRGQIVTFLHRAYVESARLSVN